MRRGELPPPRGATTARGIGSVYGIGAGSSSSSRPGSRQPRGGGGGSPLLPSVGGSRMATIGRGGTKTLRVIFLLSDLACRLSHPTPFFEFWSYSCRCTPLHAAVYNANLPAVVALLEMGADVDSRRHRFKLTPLHLAAQGGHDAIAQHLLEAGAQRGLRDAKGRTAAKWAALRGHAALHALLLADAQ